MAVEIPVFWQALGNSGLLPPGEINHLAQAFSGVKGAATQGNARTLAEWLIAEGKITRYQSTLLLAGTPGPFLYGEYCVQERIGKGILVGRFRATHMPTGHPVVLEFISGPVASDPNLWQRVRQRALQECALHHPNLLRSHELVDLPTHKFLVMEDLAGHSAANLLDTHGPAPAAEAARLARLAALGLAYLHEQGSVAADIRPEALWLEPEGNVRLVREPLAAPASLQQLPEHLASIRAEYAAPELAAQGKTPDPLTDIYALGCTLYQLLLGRTPFAGSSLEGAAGVQEKLHRHASEPAMGLESPNIPPALAECVMYMMAKNPHVRYRTAGEVAERLAGFIDPQLAHITSTAPPASLAAYEEFLKSRPAPQPAPQPVVNAPVPSPAPAANPGNSFPGIQVGSNGSHAAAPASAPVSSPQAAAPAAAPAAAITIEAQATRGVAVAEPQSPAAASPAPQVDIAAPTPSLVQTGSVSQRLNKSRDRTKTPTDTETDNSKRNLLFAVGGMAICAVLLVVAIVFSNKDQTASTDDSPATKPDATHTSGGSSSTGGSDRPSAPGGPAGPRGVGGSSDAGQQLIDDDGMTLWASPTEGEPVDFSYVPPAGQFFLIVRPADLLALPEGKRVLEALEPQIGASLEEFQAAAGVKIEDIEQILLSLHPYNNLLHPSLRVTMANRNANVTSWPNSTEVTRDGRRYSAGEGWYFFAPPAEAGRVFVMGGEQEVRDVIDNQTSMRRELKQLAEATDEARHVTVLFAPNFLFSEGQALFAGTPREKLLNPLEWFLGRDLLAASFSLHLQSDYTYLEGRFIGQLDKTPLIRAGELRERLAESPAQFERYLATLNPHPYGRVMLNRLPQMLYFIHDNTRIDRGEDRDAVMVSIVPPYGAHNLALASELALSMSSGSPGEVAVEPTGPQSIEDLLEVKTDLSFAQTSLEFSMRDLSQAIRDATGSLPFEFEIKILGGDLQLNGITRNQQVRDFDAQDQTVAEILTALVMKANPVTTVQSPSEEDQKLIWVIGPDPDVSTRQIILITTRESAAAKGYQLPNVFQPE